MSAPVDVEVTVRLDYDRLARSFEEATDKAQAALDWQVISDTDPYVPFDTGNLAKSVLSSDLGSGELVYDAVYAKKQYYGSTSKSKTHHPLATNYWFERSKAVNKRRWREVAARAMRRFR